MLKRGAWLLLVGAIPGMVGAAAGGESPDEAQFNYAHGFDATGQFEGRCGLNGVRFSAARVDQLTFESKSSSLTVYEAYVNHTIVYGPAPRAIAELDRINETTYALSGGPVRVHAGAGSNVALVNVIFNGEATPMEATFSGSQLRGAPTQSTVPTASGLGHYYWEPRDEGALYAPQVIPGPAFMISVDAARFYTAGTGFIKMDETRIEAGAFQLQLPAFRRVVDALETPLVSHRRVVETYGVLSLTEFSAVLDASGAEPICSTVDWGGRGVVTFRSAAGYVSRRDEQRSFNQRELTLSGEFASQAYAFQAVNEPGQPSLAQAHAGGQFDAVGLDFAPLSFDVPRRLGIQELGLAAVLLGGLGAVLAALPRFVAFFYTRVGSQRALDHPVRSLLYHAAHDRPGFILKDAVLASGRPYAVVRHHAGILAHLGLIRTLRWGRALHVYPHDASLKVARRNLVWEKNERVRYAVGSLGRPGKPMVEAMRELQAKFGLSRMGSWKVLRRAETAGWLRREERPEGVWLCAQA